LIVPVLAGTLKLTLKVVLLPPSGGVTRTCRAGCPSDMAPASNEATTVGAATTSL
jgi:hypothetical protein